MTLIEVLVAFSIFLLVMAPLSYLLDNEVGQAATARQHLTAIDLAEKWIEILSNEVPPTNAFGEPVIGQPAAPVGPTGTVPSVVLAGITYHLAAEYTWAAGQNGGNAPDLCKSGSPQVLDLQVTVTWGYQLYQTDTTVLDYPTVGLQQLGFLGLQVYGDTVGSDASGNAWSERVQSIPVRISGPQSLTIHPDANGCAFAEVQPGTYTVSVGDPVPGVPPGTDYGSPSFVANISGQPAAWTSSPISVSVSQITDVSVAYDEGSVINLGYPSSTGLGDSLACPGVGIVLCVASGESNAGADVTWTNGASWVTPDTLATSVSRISSVACASGGTCIGVGWGTTGGGAPVGVIASASSTSPGQVTLDSLPPGVSATALSGVACPAANGCMVIGAGPTGPLVLVGSVGSGGDTWTAVGPPTGAGLLSLSSLACPSSAVCQATGTATVAGATVPVVLRLSGTPGTGPVTASLDTLGPGVVSLSQVTCPSASVCVAIGLGPSGPVVVKGTIGGTNGTWATDALPTGVGSLTQVACTSARTCIAIGAGTSGPVAMNGSLDTTGDTWSTDTLPSTVSALSQVACDGSNGCILTGIGSGTGPTGVVLAGSRSNGWEWSLEAVPPADPVLYFDGAACAASSSTCVVTGATPTGAVLLGSTGGPVGPWSDTTPTGLAGTYPSVGIPLTLYDANLQPQNYWVPVPAGTSPDATQLPDTFPFAAGYSIFAGDCQSEGTATASASFSTTPGGATSTTVPLGLLAVQALATNGAPESATVSILSSTPGCPADTYNLRSTGPDGLSRTEVPYGTYSLSVTGPSGTPTVETIQVTGNAVVVGSVATQLPTAITVVAP